VSHERLLVANGHRGTPLSPPTLPSPNLPSHASPPPFVAPFTRPLALADVASGIQAGPTAATCDLPARPESAKAARDFTRRTLREWQMARLSDVAELVVSEIVTNALRHGMLSARWMPGEHPIRLRLLRQDPYLMCMVTDPDSAGPVRIDTHASAESGRGLQVVESCSVRWGWQPLGAGADERAPGDAGGEDGPGGRGGKVVWALLQ
jgi:anti-sigma regulatory factor (Ser/Thr protein kinase)